MGAEYGEAQKGGLINVAHTHKTFFQIICSHQLISSGIIKHCKKESNSPAVPVPPT